MFFAEEHCFRIFLKTARVLELRDEDSRIYRPRQIYTGATERDFVPMEARG